MVGTLHIARIFLAIHFLVLLLHFSFNGMIRPLSNNPDWMERDTKVKAKLCFILYGLCTPAMIVSAYISCDGVLYTTPHDGAIMVGAIVSIALTVLACYCKYKNNTSKAASKIATASWIFPLIVGIGHIIMYKDTI